MEGINEMKDVKVISPYSPHRQQNRIGLGGFAVRKVFFLEIISGVENPMRDEEQHKQEGNTRAGLSPTYDIFDFVA